MFFRWEGKTLYLDCSIQPKVRETCITGKIGDRLKIRLTAAPTDGKANKQLIKFLADQFQVKQSAIKIISGHASRLKSVCINHPNAFPDPINLIQDR
ncbi:MAG: DUF167 family protein [Proteobacteria bacterium]|nr:DUF167 family protein [Pseudomonadota bacterium]